MPAPSWFRAWWQQCEDPKSLVWRDLEVLRKVSACDDDRHFSKTLQFPHALKGHSPAIRAPKNNPAFLGLGPKRNCDFEGLRST